MVKLLFIWPNNRRKIFWIDSRTAIPKILIDTLQVTYAFNSSEVGIVLWFSSNTRYKQYNKTD